MRMPILFLVAVAAFWPFHLWAQVDGLYWVSDKPTPVSITAFDGRLVYLGEPFTEKIDEARLLSHANDNSRFSLDLIQNKPTRLSSSPREVALVLQKKCLRLSMGPDGPQRTEYSTYEAPGPVFANLAAIYFKIIPELRYNPGHQFKTRFVVDPQGYRLSEPMVVKLEITNCGAKPFLVPSPGFGAENHSGGPFDFTAYSLDQGRKPVENLRRLPILQEGIFARLQLKPGETQSIPVDLKRYLNLDKAGVYSVHGRYAFEILNDDRTSYHYPFLWDDAGTAEFTLKIE